LLAATYALALLALLAAIFGVAVYLVVDGTDALSVWLDEHWSGMQAHLCMSALSATCGAHGAADVTGSEPVITFDEAMALATSHLVAITTLIILLFLVLIVDLAMACVLQYIVARSGSPPLQLELEPLAPDDDDD